MKVCDDKITKLKERIKSELPVYSQKQINRSREVTLECALSLTKIAQSIHNAEPVFNSPLKDEVLRKVFKDQTERAILKSKQISNTRTASAKVQMVHGQIFKKNSTTALKKIKEEHIQKRETGSENGFSKLKIAIKKLREVNVKKTQMNEPTKKGKQDKDTREKEQNTEVSQSYLAVVTTLKLC